MRLRGASRCTMVLVQQCRLMIRSRRVFGTPNLSIAFHGAFLSTEGCFELQATCRGCWNPRWISVSSRIARTETSADQHLVNPMCVWIGNKRVKFKISHRNSKRIVRKWQKTVGSHFLLQTIGLIFECDYIWDIPYTGTFPFAFVFYSEVENSYFLLNPKNTWHRVFQIYVDIDLCKFISTSSNRPSEASKSAIASQQMMTFSLSIDSSSVRPRGGRLGWRGISWYDAPQMLITDDIMHRTL